MKVRIIKDRNTPFIVLEPVVELLKQSYKR